MGKRTHFMGVKMRSDEYVPDWDTMWIAIIAWSFFLSVAALAIVGTVFLLRWLI